MTQQRLLKHGFTLIELLVVIAIISLLVSILLPSLNKAMELAKRTTCASNLRSVGIGWHFYTEENNGLGPYNHRDKSYGGNLNVFRYWTAYTQAGLLLEYMGCDPETTKTPERLICPSDRYGRKKPSDFPLADGSGYGETSYLMNHLVCSFPNGLVNSLGEKEGSITVEKQPIERAIMVDFMSWWDPEAWTANHGNEGMNVLRVGGNVSWMNASELGPCNPYNWLFFEE